MSGNGAYTSGTFTPTVVGIYYWTAFYSGDPSTFNQSVTTNCLDSNEASVVGKRNTSLTTSETLVPNDSAAVSPSSATGPVDFYLFEPNSACSVGNETNAAYHETAQLSGGSASTTNASNTDTLASGHANALGTWSWLVSYAGDTSDNGSSSVCTEAFTITNP